MRIAMVGTGYVGLVSGACFSEFGTEVVCIDNDAAKIKRLEAGEIPIFEPGLEVLVENNRAAGRLTFTTDLAKAVGEADAVFIAVGTPTGRTGGEADLTYVYDAVREVAGAMNGYTVIVNKSTVPVGTGREVERLIRQVNPSADFDVASNPEFLREGAAINDFMRPDRVIIGCESERARDVMRALYRPLFLIETPILFTTLETAELTKYAGNAFLATKITFINEIADLCEKVGANVHDVARGIGLDGRIGRKFLHAGPGFGGSCFPKDCLALVHTARQHEAPQSIVETVLAVNAARKKEMAQRVIEACGGNVRGKTAAEHVFHLFLSLLHDTGSIDEADLPHVAVRQAIRTALALVYGAAAKAGVAHALGTIAMTNGRSFFAVRLTAPLYLRRLAVPGPRSARDERFRGVVVVSDAPEPPGDGFEEIPQQSILSVSRDVTVDVVSLDS